MDLYNTNKNIFEISIVDAYNKKHIIDITEEEVMHLLQVLKIKLEIKDTRYPPPWDKYSELRPTYIKIKLT